MAEFVFQLEPDVQAIVLRRGGDVDGSMRRRADEVATRARQNAPSKTGALRDSITVSQSRTSAGQFASGWDVTADAPYAKFVHEGTRPHQIEGRPLLVFDWDVTGRTMFLRRVQHPGTDAQPFLRDALQQVIQ